MAPQAHHERMEDILFGVPAKENLLKYERIIEELKEAVRVGNFRLGKAVPSITAVSRELGCSRETVVKAYDILKKEGVLDSRPGKGFFIASEKIANCPRVLLLLNNLTPYMEVLYNAFLGALADRALVDVFFHHNRIEIFEKLLRDHRGRYFSYIIKPFAHKRIPDALRDLAAADTLILDRREGIGDGRSHIAQNFRDDLRASLEQGRERLSRYEKLVLVYSPRQVHPAVCVEAFGEFLHQNRLKGEVIERIRPEDVADRTAYLTITDEDLVSVLKGCRERGWQPGQQVGIISYNDTPLKEFVSGGLTVISADFAQMGREAATFALTKQPVQTDVFARLIERASL